MAARLPAYLHRDRCGVFGFRFVVPGDLRHLFAQTEYRISLRTTSGRAAKLVTYSLTLHVQLRLRALRAMQDPRDGERFMDDLREEVNAIRARFETITTRREEIHGAIDALGAEFRALLSAGAGPL
jgi:hypothetical protein